MEEEEEATEEPHFAKFIQEWYEVANSFMAAIGTQRDARATLLAFLQRRFRQGQRLLQMTEENESLNETVRRLNEEVQGLRSQVAQLQLCLGRKRAR
eukprot:s2393_g4.t1